MRKLYLILLLIALNSTVLFAQIYVTETGAGNKDGTSWANAYDNTQLQQAINEAESATIKQVWVAKGTYKPTEILSATVWTDATGNTASTTSNRDMAFILKTGVAIYGGFAGTESSVNDRVDISTANETILSGDLNNDNTANTGDAYHVVATRNDADGAILDGFTIQHGYASNGDYAEIDGGSRIRRSLGAIAVFSNKTVSFKNLVLKNNGTNNAGAAVYSRALSGDTKFYFTNVRFENNIAPGTGGAMYSLADAGASELNITNCVFLNNKGGGGTGGGALYFAGDSNDAILNITNSQFEGNEVSHSPDPLTATYGGALRIGTGVANLLNTVFIGNKITGTATDTRGGAIYSTGSSTVNISGCTFDNNQAISGAHYYIFNGKGTITNNTTFQNGIAGGNGGAIFVASGAESLSVSQSTFISNAANGATGGGAIYSNNLLFISKCKFYSNTAEASGGALCLSGTNTFLIDNSVFYNNISKSASATSGAAIYQAAAGSELKIVNSTFYFNKSGCTEANGGGAVSFYNSLTTKLSIYNSIFHKNVRDYTNNGGVSIDFRRISGSNSAIQHYGYNLIQSSLAAATGRTIAGNINNANPTTLFASITEGDYNFLWPMQTGISVNAGNDKDKDGNDLYAANAKDLLDHPRANGTIDLGAIEWSTVLPVKISSFTANLVNNRTQLKWSVGTEDNVNRYEIERSQNGADFTKVAEVSANGSASYQTADNSPQAGDNYYRLVTIDNDGSRSQYDVVRIVKVASLTAQRERLQVYPNPVKGNEVKVSLDSPAGTYGYKVVNTSGSVVQQGSINYNGSFATINFSPSVASGIYVLHFSNGTQAKLVKE